MLFWYVMGILSTLAVEFLLAHTFHWFETKERAKAAQLVRVGELDWSKVTKYPIVSKTEAPAVVSKTEVPAVPTPVPAQ